MFAKLHTHSLCFKTGSQENNKKNGIRDNGGCRERKMETSYRKGTETNEAEEGEEECVENKDMKKRKVHS